MRAALLREVQMEYEALRAQNQAEEARRQEEAQKADPVIGELLAKRVGLFNNSARRAFALPQEAEEIGAALSRDIAALQKKIRARLVSAGFPEDYLQPVYQCPKCRDTGYVGEPVRERCECFGRMLRARMMSGGDCGLNAGERFAAYDAAVFSGKPLDGNAQDSQQAYMERMRARCEAYAEEYPNNARRNLMMIGMSGLGKTFLLNCIGNRVREKGEEVLKLTAYQLTERMRASIFDRDTEAFSVLLDIPFLLLDDLGVEPLINNITIEQLYTLLNERNLSGLHTAVSTNLQPDELQKRYTERVFSRLFDMQNTTVLAFKGSDIRLRRAPC